MRFKYIIKNLFNFCRIFTYFINLFGFPFKGKSSYGAFNSVKYVKGGILCRNGVRQVGKNISIDECNGNINLEEYITNPEIRKIFEEEYVQKKVKEISEKLINKSSNKITN